MANVVGTISSSTKAQIDKSLTVSGMAADAEATGKAIDEAKAEALEHTDAHANLKNNPHNVTAEQLGLENVDNTSDMDKPVSTAQATAIADAKKAGTDAQKTAENAETNAKEYAKEYAESLASSLSKNVDNANEGLFNHIRNNNNPHDVTATQIEAAASFSSVDDCDTAREYGKYKIRDTTLNTPPNGAVAGNVLVVVPWDKNTGVQFFFDVFKRKNFFRTFFANAFSSWREILSSDHVLKKVWENASVGSDFHSQTISVDLSSYRFIMLVYNISGAVHPLSKIFPVGKLSHLSETYLTAKEEEPTATNDLIGHSQRLVDVGTSFVNFGEVYYCDQTNWSHTDAVNVPSIAGQLLKPVAIYGIA